METVGQERVLGLETTHPFHGGHRRHDLKFVLLGYAPQGRLAILLSKSLHTTYFYCAY